MSDSGLALLKDCKNLMHVIVQKTKVTKAGVEKLSDALPNCRIEYDGGTVGPKPAPAPKP